MTSRLTRYSWLSWLASSFCFSALCACTTTPEVGAQCDTQEVYCNGPVAVLACVNGLWNSFPCEGPSACNAGEGLVVCDVSHSRAGNPCPPWAAGSTVCQTTPAGLLTCTNGFWTAQKTCDRCEFVSGAANCEESINGCDPAKCSGCCATDGTCIATPLNQSPDFCGAVGSACVRCDVGKICDSSFQCADPVGCSELNCADGCCSNGQCIRAPLSPTDAFCGVDGNNCEDCGKLGLICRTSSQTCELPANTGGGSGSGGGTATGGGSGTGGGTGSTGGGSGGGSGAGGGGGTTDPCMGVPVGGQCLSQSLIRYCVVPTGSGKPTVQTYSCPGGSACQTTSTGATCVSTAVCNQGDTRCVNNTMQNCNSNGAWVTGASCGTGSCKAGPTGAYCAPTTPTITLTGTLKYETKNARFSTGGFIESTWSAATTANAVGVTVISYKGATQLDATSTDQNGGFTVRVPMTAASGDRVVFLAAGGESFGIDYAIADPQFGSGTFNPGQKVNSPRVWSWSKDVSSLANNGTTTVTVAQGSGALNMFDVQRSVWVQDKALHGGRVGARIVIWMGIGTEWSCGACFIDFPGNGFASQIFIGGDSLDEPYWSDPTIAHELGHWAMASYGTDPNEGGVHVLSVKTFPGQAWSEGWATFHSAAIRNTGVFWDRQGGGMFWMDLNARKYFPGSTGEQTIPRTIPNQGLMQQIDENDVSAMLWSISQSRQTALREIHNALSSPHLNTAPWPRGYTRHTWDTASNGTKTNVVNTGQPSLFLGDFLDALRCSGFPANLVDAATSPATAYPYTSASPMCRSGSCYGCTSSGSCQPGNVATACGSGGVACASCASNQTCTNGVCL